MRALAVAPNVVCNLSGLGNTVPKWTEARSVPTSSKRSTSLASTAACLRPIFPTDGAFSTMHAVWEAFLSIAKAFAAEERDKLFAANAIRHYRLAI
jgi:predicted TIM-barrel fold metal-dependent hydrolase